MHRLSAWLLRVQPTLTLCLVLATTQPGCEGQDVNDWKVAQEADTRAAYEDFVKNHPTSTLRRAALHKLDDPHFEEAKSKNDEALWLQYLSLHPEGNHVAEANSGLLRVRYDRAIEAGTEQALQQFLRAHPDSTFTPVIEKRLLNITTLSKLKLEATRVTPAGKRRVGETLRPNWKIGGTLKNSSDKQLKRVSLKLILYDGSGNEWDQREVLPVISSQEQGPASLKKPLEPGKSRAWEHVTWMLPEDFKGQVKVWVEDVAW